jgi:Hpt domain
MHGLAVKEEGTISALAPWRSPGPRGLCPTREASCLRELSTEMATPSVPDRRFEKRRDAFLVRLRNDRARLTILAAELSRGADAVRSFENLQSLAHEVRGAATTFDATEVEIAARALERAAGDASALHAGNSDVDVWIALETLRDLLGNTSGGRAAV